MYIIVTRSESRISAPHINVTFLVMSGLIFTLLNAYQEFEEEDEK